jgi:Na+/proline symporter
MSYARFLEMIAVSTVVMFGLMNLNTYALDHVFYSQTRTWMAVVMGAAMALVMLGFMWSMYKNRRVNVGIVAGSVVAFVLALFLVRSQETVSDVSYMKAMIPHHSIAIMTSERAHIRDPRVRKLADEILEAQVREIGEMKWLIEELERSPPPAEAEDLPPPSAKRPQS